MNIVLMSITWKILSILKDTNPHKYFTLTWFIRKQSEALIQGEYQYGSGCKEQLYLTRLTKELKEYKKKGNKEQLINIANYCVLESMFPEHKNHHYNDEVDSVTRAIVAKAKRRTMDRRVL